MRRYRHRQVRVSKDTVDAGIGCRRRRRWCTYILELLLQQGHHVLLNHDALLVQVLDDEVVVVAVDIHDDGLDGRVALDEHAYEAKPGVRRQRSRPGSRSVKATGRGFTDLGLRAAW